MQNFDLYVDLTDDGADLVLEGGDLKGEKGLRTAVLASVFSDARAPADAVLPELGSSRGGWWAEEPASSFGSRVWLERRSVASKATEQRMTAALVEAFTWLSDEEIARGVEVRPSRLGDGALGFEVAIARGNARRFELLWDQIAKLPGTTSLEGVYLTFV